MKTLILRKKITSPKIEITLPPDFKKGEEILIKIEKKEKRKTKLTDLLWIFEKYDNWDDYDTVIYEYIKEKHRKNL